MRRIAFALLGLALVGALSSSCSSDSPGPTPPKAITPGSSGSGALQIRLFTSNANPPAGTCTAIQALVTLNGANVPDGTGVTFSTDLSSSSFQQNGLPLISVVTQSGAATTALCSTGVGLATVRASATVGSNSATATITIAFQASPNSGPFFTFCSPSFGPATGGTTLTINGGRFSGTPSTTRATFTAAGVTREALVTAVTSTSVTLITPAFPEATSSSVPVNITLTFGTATLSLPNCFAFGSAPATTPTITAVLPSSGSNEGNTRVTIIGSGFSAPAQVFFGPVEAQVQSISFNQIVVLTPPASGAGLPNLNSTVTVRVHEVDSGLDATLTNGFRFVTALQLTAIDNNQQRVDQPFTAVTIHGQGFLAPVAVTLAGIPAKVVSVAATELVVIPGTPFLSACTDVSGAVVVTNIDSGDTQSGLSFIYLVAQTKPSVTSVSPSAGAPGIRVTITGTNLGSVTSVSFGGRAVPIDSGCPHTDTSFCVIVPDNGAAPPVCPAGVADRTPVNVGSPVDIIVTSSLTTCTSTLAGAFQYQIPCLFPTPSPFPTLVPTNTPPPTTTPTPTPTVGGIADLSLTKSGSPGTVVSGGTLTYQLAVTNVGPNPSTGVVLTDHLPAGTSFQSCAESQGSCTGPAVGTPGPVDVVVSFGTVPSGSAALATIVVTVTASAGNSFTNFASVTAQTFDPNPSNNTASAFTVVTGPSADLSIGKTASPNIVFTGKPLTYSINVVNNGPNPASFVEVSDPLPAGTTFTSCLTTLGTCGPVPAVGTNGTVRVEVGNMAASSTATITIQVNVTAPGGTSITNTATVTSNTPDSNVANNTSSVTTSVSP